MRGRRTRSSMATSGSRATHPGSSERERRCPARRAPGTLSARGGGTPERHRAPSPPRRRLLMASARAAALDELIDPDATLTLLASGYEFTEGPVWNVDEQALYFSDIPGDARWRWSEEGGAELVTKPTFKGNGMAYDLDGSLLCCEQVSSCLVRLRQDGSRELVAFPHGGKYLNSPNDVVVRSDGSIYFTDPDYGRWNDWI